MIRGVYPVIQIPLDADENIDQKVLANEIEWLISKKCAGLVLAMVSEVMRFSFIERRTMWKLVLENLQGRIPLIVSVGSESTAIAVNLAQLAEADGVTALMATPPAAFPASENEIYIYYKSIIQSVNIPVIIQDASNYMGQPLAMSLYEKLLDEFGVDRVLFKPEAKPIKERMQQLQKIAKGKAKVFEGQSGVDLLVTHPLGLAGAMPGAEIVWAVIALWDALESNDLLKAERIHVLISKLVVFQTSLDAYVAVEKYLLVKQGVFESVRQRGPVNFKLDQETKNEIDLVFEQLLALLQ